MEKEIIADLNVTEEEQNLIFLHSIVNILNILSAEIFNFQLTVDDIDTFRPKLRAIREVANSLADSTKSSLFFSNIDNFNHELLTSIDNYIASKDLLSNQHIRAIKDNIHSICDTLKQRAEEINNSDLHSTEFIEMNIEQIEYEISSFFAAIEKNSKGKYKIVNNIAVFDDNAYLVDFNINSIYGQHIYLPKLFISVIRDLMANARKYTKIGGMILAGLMQDENNIVFAVEDNGIGIPENELDKIIGFKYRASNVTDKRTFGGGFGLTKAYIITKQLGGRMWIKSTLGTGTRIIIQIPYKKGQ